MIDEYIDIVNKQGIPTGETALKSVIHKKGYYHNTAHIWFYTKNGGILLSQRSAKKTICPLMWDVSVAGHIDAGETIEHGALREIKEEIGLTISENELKKIGIFECFQDYKNGIIDNEFHHTYMAELKVPMSKLIPQEDEVEALKLVAFDTFKWFIDNIDDNNNHFVASNKAYYYIVFQHIIKTINKSI